jgi:hypothetical protein
LGVQGEKGIANEPTIRKCKTHHHGSNTLVIRSDKLGRKRNERGARGPG